MKRYKVRLVDNEFRGLEAIDQTGVQAGMTRIALGDCHLYLAHEADAEIAKLKELLHQAVDSLEGGFESISSSEAEWSIADKQLVDQIKAAL